MPNLRIISDNAAERATITASSQAGALGPGWLKTDIKSEVWRTTSTAATLTVSWPTGETVGAVALPFCNLTSAATIRVVGYDAAGAVVVDSGTIRACAYAKFGQFDWGYEPLAVNAYRRAGANQWSAGGGAYARAWLTQTRVRSLTITIGDPHNPDGYIEASRLVVGIYWSPQYNADYGASIQSLDTSTQYRTDGGDQLVVIGPRSRKLQFNLAHLTPTDRARLMGQLRRNGLSAPAFISLFPESDESRLEQDHQIYGRLSDLGAVSLPYFNNYSAPITIEEL